MELPESWVDRIFEKLLVTYGREFSDRWTGQDMAVVKRAWAHDLGSLTLQPHLIAFALDNLPPKPPTVVGFRALARECTTPAAPMKQIEHTPVKADPHRVAKLLQRLREKPEGVGPRQWAYDLVERHKSGDKRPVACLRLARQAIAIDQGEVAE